MMTMTKPRWYILAIESEDSMSACNNGVTSMSIKHLPSRSFASCLFAFVNTRSHVLFEMNGSYL
jgi:hypothetical protein